MAGHLTLARNRRWYEHVDLFISPTHFLRDKFVSYGYPSDRFVVQGHYLAHPVETAPDAPSNYVLYLGRLSEEKGVRWLLQVFENPPVPIKLRLAGDGPLRPAVERALSDTIFYDGFLTGDEKESAIRHALAVVLPSRCYENFPVTVMEANQWGVPVIVSRLGGLTEMVRSGLNGATFDYTSPESFWKTLNACAQDDSQAARLSCQRHAQAAFAPAGFLQTRLKLYESLLSKRV